jgi:hypothetical protein
VVFESDDWGLCGEGKDRPAHDRLASKGYDFAGKGARMYLNTLESREDLDRLFRALSSFKDSLGRNPVFTANFVVANPDFSRIKESGYKNYHFVPITDGFPGSWRERESPLSSWREGIARGLFVPEYHGFSHFNHSNWIEGLRKGDRRLKDFFEEEMFSSSKGYPTIAEYGVRLSGRIAYRTLVEQYSEISRGVKIFRRAFSRNPRTTIPPHDISNTQTLLAFSRAGVNFVQSEKRQVSSMLDLWPRRPSTPIAFVTRVISELSLIVRTYRNVRLEMEEYPSEATLDLTRKIFSMGGPAVVGTHRQNYVSGLDRNNSEEGRERLVSYLKGLSEDPLLTYLSSFEGSQLMTKGCSVEKFGDEFLLRNYRRSDLRLFVSGAERHHATSLTDNDSAVPDCEPVQGGMKVNLPAGRVVKLVPSD